MDDVSAFVVVAPEAEPWVGALRAAHDPSAADGVPAHVTLLYPFRPLCAVDARAQAAAAALAACTPPFAYTLARIARFERVLYVAPEPAAPFVALVRALAAAFPEHPPYGGVHDTIVPHLSVAQGEAATLDAAESALRAAWPSAGVAARCTELVLMANDTGRWRRAQAWALGGVGAESPPGGPRPPATNANRR